MLSFWHPVMPLTYGEERQVWSYSWINQMQSQQRHIKDRSVFSVQPKQNAKIAMNRSKYQNWADNRYFRLVGPISCIFNICTKSHSATIPKTTIISLTALTYWRLCNRHHVYCEVGNQYKISATWNPFITEAVPSNLTFRRPCIVMYSYNKTKQTHQFLKFILGIELHMFRTVSLCVDRSPALYTQQ